MADNRVVDEHLGAVLKEVLDAVYQSKQVSWAASTSPLRAELQELTTFLIDQSGRFMVAEESIDGRAEGVASPSAHQRGNLVADQRGDLAAAVSVLVGRLGALAADVRQRGSAIADSEYAPMFTALADGLDERAACLGPRD